MPHAHTCSPRPSRTITIAIAIIINNRNTWDAMVQLNKAEGWKGFWRGFTPCMLRACPANAACFFAYETARSLLG
jgi:hypothetical protein